MTIKLFGRSGCARTRRVYLRLMKWMGTFAESKRVEVVYFDLETAAGLAEAAFEQLEGELPLLIVEVEELGTAGSTAPLFGDRDSIAGEGVSSRFFPSRN